MHITAVAQVKIRLSVFRRHFISLATAALTINCRFFRLKHSPHRLIGPRAPQPAPTISHVHYL